MTTPRTLAGVGLSAALLLSLTACFQLPIPTPNNGGGGDNGNGGDNGGGTEVDPSSIIDTTWAGTDSDGDDWEFTFQEDNTVALVLNDQPFDDPADTYSLNGTSLSITVSGFEQGNAEFTGEYAGPDQSIDLDGDLGGHAFSLTLDPQ